MKTYEEAVKEIFRTSPKGHIPTDEETEEWFTKTCPVYDVDIAPGIFDRLSNSAAVCVDGMPGCCTNCQMGYVREWLKGMLRVGIAIGIEMEKQEWPSSAE